jgi:hypothetical protein
MDDTDSATIMRRAMDQFQRDRRFQMIAQSCAAFALEAHGPVDPERADQEAHDIALAATVMLLQRVYTEDAELLTLRLERDHYKELVEEVLVLIPPRPQLITT